MPSPPKHVADSGNARDPEAHAGVERAYMAGMHPQGLARAKVPGDDFAREFDPGSTRSADMLRPEAVGAEDARQRLLKSHPKLNLRRGANEAVAMYQVFVSIARRDNGGLSPVFPPALARATHTYRRRGGRTKPDRRTGLTICVDVREDPMPSKIVFSLIAAFSVPALLAQQPPKS